MTNSVEGANEVNIKDVGWTGSRSKYNQTEPDIQEKHGCTLRNMIQNIKLKGGKPSVDRFSLEMNRLSTTDRVSAFKALQSTRGNRYVQKVVAQAKLDINMPGDINEQEADSIANRIMRMPEPANQSAAEVPQMTHVPDKRIMLPDFHPKSHGSGQPLTKQERAFFESKFDHDFSHVQIHVDAVASESAKAIGAKAYTIGQNIAFDAGHYNPGTALGRRLIAHELTHVIQQQGSGNDGSLIQRDDQDDPRRPRFDPPSMPTDDTNYIPGFTFTWPFGSSPLKPSVEGHLSDDDKSLSTDQMQDWANRFQWRQNCPIEKQDPINNRCCDIGEVFDVHSFHCIPARQRSKSGMTPPLPSTPSSSTSLPSKPVPSKPPDCPEEKWNANVGICCGLLEMPKGLGCEGIPVDSPPSEGDTKVV